MAVCGTCSAAAKVGYPAHLVSLTRLRFFAALWVVFYHWRAPWDFDVDTVTQLLAMGRFGVDLFFILSGFVLAHVYLLAREEGRFDFARLPGSGRCTSPSSCFSFSSGSRRPRLVCPSTRSCSPWLTCPPTS